MKSDKNICFLTGGIESGPVGGYKVMYEYANRLSVRGWNVSIVYPFLGKGDIMPKYLLKHPLSSLSILRKYMLQRWRKIEGGTWFKIDARVKKIYLLQNSSSLPDRFAKGTKFIATYITTVEDLNRFNIPITDKFNLIQDFEAWFGYSTADVLNTYRYPMTKIVISEWLAGKVQDAGSSAIVIPNGLDFKYFSRLNPIEQRDPASVAMLWHQDCRKRTEDAMSALKLVKEKHPEMHVVAFGAFPRPDSLPDWIKYIQRPNREVHNGIYNNAAIFVASSEQEGWGLTPCEAMQCGAAVACTDIGGYRMFAKDGETALLSPVRNPKALAANICRLIEDDNLRIHIATEGNRNIQQFTWERSVALFESALLGENGRSEDGR